MPAIRESYTCCDRFADRFEKVTGQKYFKKDRDIYRKLVQYGDEKKVIQITERCYKKCVDDGKKKPSGVYGAAVGRGNTTKNTEIMGRNRMEQINVLQQMNEFKKILSYSKNIGFFFGTGTSCAFGLPNIISITDDVESNLDDDKK